MNNGFNPCNVGTNKCHGKVFVEWCTVIMEKVKDTRTPFYRPPISQQESESVHPDILILMKQCWAEEPAERPSFDEITKALRNINKGKSVLFIIKHFAFGHMFVLY